MPTNPGPILVYYGPHTPIVNTTGSPAVDTLQNPTFQVDPMIDRTAQAMINARFVPARNYWLLYQNITQACYNMTNGSIDNAFKFSNDPKPTGWNLLMEFETILDQLVATYGRPMPNALLQNNTSF